MIEVVSQNNIADVLPLIRQYKQFYKVADICDQRNRDFFSQFGENNSQGCQFILRINGKVAAFATVYLSYNSTLPAKVAILNDLFTLEKYALFVLKS